MAGPGAEERYLIRSGKDLGEVELEARSDSAADGLMGSYEVDVRDVLERER